MLVEIVVKHCINNKATIAISVIFATKDYY